MKRISPITGFASNKTRDVIALFFIVFIVLLYRRYDAFTNPQFWAEDALIIFKQVEEQGIKSIFIPYSGYLFMLPRLLAFLYYKLSVSYAYIPLLYNYSAFLITFFVSYGMYECAAHLNLRHKLVFATWFLFMPVAPDLFMPLASIGWMTGLYLICYIFALPPIENMRFYTVHLILLFIISLTHPFSALFAPIIIVVLILERKELTMERIVPYLTILLGGFIQFIYIAFIDTGFYRGYPGTKEPHHLLRLFTNNIREMIFLRYGYFPQLPDRVELVLCSLLFIAFLFALSLAYRRVSHKRKYTLVAAALICFASFIKAYWPNESYVLALYNARYYFIPFACLGWIFIIALDKKINFIYIIAYLLFFKLHERHVKFSLPDKHWNDELNEFYEHKRDAIDINPEGWKYTPDRTKMRKPS